MNRSRLALKNIGDDGTPAHPSPGDMTVGCVHLPEPQHCHFYYFTGKLEFERPDGKTCIAQWMLLCHECADAVQGEDLGAALDDGRIQIGCDSPWPEGLELEIRSLRPYRPRISQGTVSGTMTTETKEPRGEHVDSGDDPQAVGGMGEPRPVNPPVPLHQRHDCGDPACDGEALTIGLKACTHGNVLYVMPTDPFHRCVLVADESSGDTAWCTACGAMRCNGRWLEPRWFSTMRPETAGSR